MDQVSGLILLRGLSEKRRKQDLTIRYEFGKVEGGGGCAKDTRTDAATVHSDYALDTDCDTFFTMMMMMIQELVNIEEKL